MANQFQDFVPQAVQVQLSLSGYMVERHRRYISVDIATHWDPYSVLVVVNDYRKATRDAYNSYVCDDSDVVSQVYWFNEESSRYQDLANAVNTPAYAVIGTDGYALIISLYESEDPESSSLPQLSMSRFIGDAYIDGSYGSVNGFIYEIESTKASWQWSNKPVPLTDEAVNTSEVLWCTVTSRGHNVSYLIYTDWTKQHGYWVEKTDKIEEIEF
jgi:hypothetical protein